jgi:hypothetical protein
MKVLLPMVDAVGQQYLYKSVDVTFNNNPYWL